MHQVDFLQISNINQEINATSTFEDENMTPSNLQHANTPLSLPRTDRTQQYKTRSKRDTPWTYTTTWVMLHRSPHRWNLLPEQSYFFKELYCLSTQLLTILDMGKKMK